MKIYIPSRARADQRNHTFEGLPPLVRNDAVLVVSKDDAKAYEHRFGKKHIMVVKKEGIGPVRQAIIDYHAQTYADGRLVMMDDDLSFFVRRKDEPTKLKIIQPAQYMRMLFEINSQLATFLHVGVAAREGANRNTERYLDSTRMLRVLAYDAIKLKGQRVRFDRCPVMEDFDVALQLLRLGYPSRILNHYAQDQGTSNAPGGCSTYRTPAVQAQGANALKELHPDYVTVVTKETKGAWGGGARTDVRIAWKKALNNG